MLQKCIFLCFAFLELSWNSNDENDNIFEPERSFSGVCNTFVNEWCVKSDKNVIKLAFRLLLFPKFLKCCKLMHKKSSTLNITTKVKCRKLVKLRNENPTNFKNC